MGIKRERKPSIVSEIVSLFENNSAVLVLEQVGGLSVEEVTAFRRSVSKSGGGYKVVKNTLAKIAVGEEHPLVGLFAHKVSLAYSKDILSVAKLVSEFAKNGRIKCVAGFFDSNVLSGDKVGEIASLPALDVMLGRLLGLMKAPATNLVSLLNLPSTMLVRVMSQYVDLNK